MSRAEVGDDSNQEDPTVNKLELIAASMFKKESALFVPSGTMANQIAIKTFTHPVDEIILDNHSHIFNYEYGGAAFHSSVQCRPLKSTKGVMALEEIERTIRASTRQLPRTSLISLENTHNYSGGAILPLEYIERVSNLAHSRGISLYIDGARIFNASVATGIQVSQYAVPADALMFCLSKGLGAPVGSLLLGSDSFIKKARMFRRLFGGNMRQAGILAAAGLVALEEGIARLNEDYKNAKYLAQELKKITSLKVINDPPETNMVMLEFDPLLFQSQEIIDSLLKQNIKVSLWEKDQFRLVTHKDIDREDVERLIQGMIHIYNF